MTKAGTTTLQGERKLDTNPIQIRLTSVLLKAKTSFLEEDAYIHELTVNVCGCDVPLTVKKIYRLKIGFNFVFFYLIIQER